MQYDVGVARDCYCYAIDAVELDRFARVGKPVRFLRDSPLYSDEAGGWEFEVSGTAGILDFSTLLRSDFLTRDQRCSIIPTRYPSDDINQQASLTIKTQDTLSN